MMWLFLLVVMIVIGIGLWLTGSEIKHIEPAERWVIRIISGFTFWSLFIFLSAWVHLRFLSLIVPITLAAWGWFRYGKNLFSRWDWDIRKNWWLGLLIVVGTGCQLYLVTPSGWMSSAGMRLYGVNAHDGLWHIALMQSLQHAFPPDLPTYAGAELKGYHYLVDLFGSELVKDFHLSPFDLVFRCFPLLFGVLTGMGIYRLMMRLTQSRSASAYAVILNYAAGSFGYMLPLLGVNSIGAESSFWAQQSVSTFLNLPLGISFSLLTSVLLLLAIWLKHPSSLRWLWLAALLAGTSISIKAYGGVLLLAGFTVVCLYQALRTRKWLVLAPAVGAIALSFSLLVLTTYITKSTFLIEPGWYLKTMMETSDRLNYPKWELLRQTYVADNNLPRLIWLWGLALAIFILGNYGSRLIGGFALLSKLRRPSEFDFPLFLFMGTIVGGGLGLPLILLQKGIVWNSIQFLYYSLFVMNILAACTIGLIKSKAFRAAIIVITVGLTIPTTISTLRSFYTLYKNDSSLLISTEQIAALTVARDLPDDSPVLVPYDETAYFTAFTGKPVFFSDQTQAEILLVPYSGIISQINSVYDMRMGEFELRDFMKTHGMRYLYATKSWDKFESYSTLKKVFSNPAAAIFEVL